MLELWVGIDLARRRTEGSFAPEPPRSRRSRAAATREFLSRAVVGLAGPTPGARVPSPKRGPVCEARAD